MVADREMQKIIHSLVEKLVAAYAPVKIILFGSYANGSPGPDSDIDLLIIKETSARLIDRMVEVRRILSDSKRSIPIEPIVITPRELEKRLSIGDQFIAGIMAEGDVLYAG